MNQHVDAIVKFFETLTPEQVERLGGWYTADAQFKDPFNAVQGLAAVQKVYRHIYVSLHAPHFIVTNRIVDGNQCFLTWEFKFSFKNFHKGVQQTVVGGSHLVLSDDGRIRMHRDYWDAAEELYEKLPVVGSLMRWLKHRANS